MTAMFSKRGSPWWILTVLFLAGLALSVRRSMVMPIDQFPVTLLGITNDPVQGRLASFIVTNESQLIIDCWVLSPQVNSNGMWSPPQQPAESNRRLQLRPGEANTFTVAAPSTAVEWREPVEWGYRPTTAARSIVGRLKSNFRLNWYLLRHGRPIRYNQGVEFNLYISYSEAITKLSPAGAKLDGSAHPPGTETGG